jgi:hypothetical protein
MSRHGFVYILANESMPGRYKIGYTMESPFARAKTLSLATGVPTDFIVMGFAGFEDPQRYESALHERFKHVRCERKEFFQSPLRPLWDALCSMEDRHCLCDVHAGYWMHDEETGGF